MRFFTSSSSRTTWRWATLSPKAFSPSPDHLDDLWRFQDFSLSLPPGFALVSHAFAPGLTRLSFTAGRLRLEVARLASAEERLKEQSMAEILTALSSVADLRFAATDDPNSCEGYRNPNFYQRFAERLRGGRPFVRARLSHVGDRLLALVLSGSRPLPDGLLREIAEGYGIV
jgi:hypothetical protein